MADTETAVLEPETTEAAPETEDTAAAELETEGSEETPETGDEPEASLSKEEVDRLLAEERKKVETELRDKAEEAAQKAAAEQRRSEAQRLRQGTGYQQLAQLAQWAHKTGEDGNELRLNPQVLNTLLGQFERGVFQEQSDAWGDAFNGFLNKSFKDFKLPREIAGRITRATTEWNPLEMVTAQFDAMRAAVREEIEAQVRAEVEAELREEAGTKNLKDTTQKRASQPKPTPVAGSGGVGGIRIASMDDADRAWNAGQIDFNQYRKERERFGIR